MVLQMTLAVAVGVHVVIIASRHVRMVDVELIMEMTQKVLEMDLIIWKLEVILCVK